MGKRSRNRLTPTAVAALSPSRRTSTAVNAERTESQPMVDRASPLAGPTRVKIREIVLHATEPQRRNADPLASLRAAVILTAVATEMQDLAVDEARAHGLTWEAIGAVLGMSKQAAHKRWGRS